LYRYLNEPEEAESICRDVLAAEPKHMLGCGRWVSNNGSVYGETSDRYSESRRFFSDWQNPTSVCITWVCCARPGEGAVACRRAPHTLLLCWRSAAIFRRAEKVHPPGNDDAILRWNRCVRLLQSQPDFEQKRSCHWKRRRPQRDEAQAAVFASSSGGTLQKTGLLAGPLTQCEHGFQGPTAK